MLSDLCIGQEAFTGIFYFHSLVLFCNTIIPFACGQLNPLPLSFPIEIAGKPGLYYSLLISFAVFKPLFIMLIHNFAWIHSPADY